MQYIRSLLNGPDFLCKFMSTCNAPPAYRLDATTDVAIWSTVEPGIGITAGSLATLRPLLQTILWHLGLADPPSNVHRPYSYPSDRSGRRRSRRLGYSNSIDMDDLGPTTVTRSVSITGPKTNKKFWNRSQDAPEDMELVPTGIKQSVVVQQQFTGPPRLYLRDSLRHSFTRGTVLGREQVT